MADAVFVEENNQWEKRRAALEAHCYERYAFIQKKQKDSLPLCIALRQKYFPFPDLHTIPYPWQQQ